MAKKVHAILSASSASRWIACPGSIRESEGKIVTSSPYADEGTAAHQVAETCLRLGIDTKDYNGDLVVVNGKHYDVTDEMKDAVQVYLDAVRAESGDLHVEVKLDLKDIYPGMFGTSDVVLERPFDNLKVFDFKYGAGVPVEIEDNPQMMYYALGALAGRYDEFHGVDTVIVQPRAHHKDGPVRDHTYKIDELVKWANEVLIPAAKATKEPDAPLVLGEHCRFCPAMATCPKHHENASVLAKEAFADVPTSPPAPETLAPAKLKKILDVASMVEAWLDACRAYARSLLETGGISSDDLGYKLVAGKSSREWKDIENAEKFLAAVLGDEAYTTPKLISPAQAEKVLKGAANKKALEPLIEKKPGGTQLAPLSDKREAVVPAIAAFEEVEI